MEDLLSEMVTGFFV